MITATLGGEEPAPQEICYPILMKDKRDEQIVLAIRQDSMDGPVQVIALSDGGYIAGKIETPMPYRLEVYHGEITLKNS